ncbi:hypothetical protein ACROYT_G031894 [Oculina patagonica]
MACFRMFQFVCDVETEIISRSVTLMRKDTHKQKAKKNWSGRMEAYTRRVIRFKLTHWRLYMCRPRPSSTDVIIFDQRRHHLYLISLGGKDLSNNTWITAFGLIELEIRTKMLRRLKEKIRGKFASTTLGYSMARISSLDHAFSGIP